MRRSISLPIPIFAILLLLGIVGGGVVYSQPVEGPLPLQQNINPLPESEAIISLVVNRERIGDVESRIELEDPFLRVSLLREVLTSSLSSAQAERIFSVILSKLEWAGIADLEAAGIMGQWNLETLTYSITTPGEYSAVRELDISPQAPFTDKTWLPPAPIAGIVNLSASGTANITETRTTLPITINANALLKLLSLAIESSGSLSYSMSDWSWYMGNTRAVHDLPSIEGRIYMGMVGGQGIAYQSRPEIYGLSLHNIENFSRYDRNYSPSTAFTLQKPSTVRIKINGNVVSVMNLDMGNYRVFDLPFAYGLNEFELEVSEGKSSEGTITYRPVTKYVALETGLLVGGKTDYGFSAGFGRSEPDQPFVSAFMRHGFQSYLTLAASLQADIRSAMTGLGFVLGTDFGGFIVNTGIVTGWDGRTYPVALAADLEYHLALPANSRAPGLGFVLGYASKGFSPPQPISIVPVPDPNISASFNVGGSVNKKTSYGLSAQWKRLLLSSPIDTASVTMNLGFSIANNSSLSISSGLRFASGKDPDFNLSFSLNASDPKKPGRQISYSQPNDGTNTITFTDRLPYFDEIGYGLRIANILGGVTEISSVSFNSGFNTQLFTLTGSGGVNFGGALSDTQGIVSLNLSTALSFAGTAFAISKPLYDSFVIFDPDRTTGDMVVSYAVDGGTRMTSHGLPVAASLGSYRKQRVTMDFPEADADVSATVPQIALSSGYRSGFLFRAGLERRFYVTGYLVDASGAPISYMAGDVVMEDGTMMDQTFTDDAGMFQIFGLTKGSYSIVWPEEIGVSKLSLVEDADGLVEVGQITATLPSRQE